MQVTFKLGVDLHVTSMMLLICSQCVVWFWTHESKTADLFLMDVTGSTNNSNTLSSLSLSTICLSKASGRDSPYWWSISSKFFFFCVFRGTYCIGTQVTTQCQPSRSTLRLWSMRGLSPCQVQEDTFFGLLKKKNHLIGVKLSKFQPTKYCVYSLLLFAGQHADGQNIIFTDGEYINQIAACKDVRLMFLLKLLFAMIITCIIFIRLSKRRAF